KNDTPTLTFIFVILTIISMVPLLLMYFNNSLKNGIKKHQSNKNTIIQYLGSQNFNIDREIEFNKGFFVESKYSTLFLDELNKKWCVSIKCSLPIKIYNFEDCISYDLFENGATIGMSKSISSSSVCTELIIRIKLKYINNPIAIISLYKGSPLNKSGDAYAEIMKTADIICSWFSTFIERK
ncbi:MAG: hypothetical protein PHI19_06275, partial [Clostridia bacterium]|nr:hypothetical protein [Clostridia bacterium]